MAVAAAVAMTAGLLAVTGAAAAPASQPTRPAQATGLGQLDGLLPRDHLTQESALQVDLSRESVRLPLYKGKAQVDRSRFGGHPTRLSQFLSTGD